MPLNAEQHSASTSQARDNLPAKPMFYSWIILRKRDQEGQRLSFLGTQGRGVFKPLGPYFHQLPVLKMEIAAAVLNMEETQGSIADAVRFADSDDLARVYRFDLAQDSEMISPTIPI
jgi:hypothetical protein